MPLPFGPQSLTGVELELIAPEGRSRRDLAERLAGSPERLQYGLKFYHLGDFDERGRPVSRLTPAYRVLDGEGVPWLTLVDDPTLRGGLPEGTEPFPGNTFRTDDVRIAKWIERHCWSDSDDTASIFARLAETFEGRWLDDEGVPVALVDRYGHALVRRMLGPLSAPRACELVTRPLSRDERVEALEVMLRAARELGFTPFGACGLHLHFDAAPWRSTPRLTALIRDVHRDTAAYRRDPLAHPGSKFLGPFPDKVLRIAHEAPADLPFDVLASALSMAGTIKHLDVNLLGAIETTPVQPTLEIRCLRATIEMEELLGAVDRWERFLLRIAEDADRDADARSHG